MNGDVTNRAAIIPKYCKEFVIMGSKTCLVILDMVRSDRSYPCSMIFRFSRLQDVVHKQLCIDIELLHTDLRPVDSNLHALLMEFSLGVEIGRHVVLRNIV